MQNIIDSVHTSNKDTYRSDFHHQISALLSVKKLHGYSDRCLRFGFSYNSRKPKTKNQKQKQKGKIFFCNCRFNSAVSLPLASTIDLFHYCHAKKIINWKPSSGRSEVQLSGLCGPQFHAENVSRTFVELCMQTPY